MRRTFATSLDRYLSQNESKTDSSNESKTDSSNESDDTKSNTYESIKSQITINNLDIFQRHSKSKTTIQLISKTLNAQLIDYRRLLYYLCNDKYYIYSTHNKYTDLVSICLDVNSQARKALKLSDIRVFTRESKFWDIAYATAKKQKTEKVKKTCKEDGTKITKNKLRLVFSSNWINNSKHDSLMVSTENDCEILCTSCHYADYLGTLPSTSQNNYKVPKKCVCVSMTGLQSHYVGKPHGIAIHREPTKAVKFFLLYYTIFVVCSFCIFDACTSAEFG